MINRLTTIDGYRIETYEVAKDLHLTIAIDFKNSELPANGGLRFCQYESIETQEQEALTLARHMAQKHQIYSTGFSGVKLVANGEVNVTNKKRLLNFVGNLLNGYGGRIYTGCDLNINNDDMNYLYTLTPYVLNGIGSDVNTSTATAYGVLGALDAVRNLERDKLSKKRFLIHGVGKIGSIIADRLLNEGQTVFTYDIYAENAGINGAINVSNDENWHKIKCDYLILCSNSGLITQNIAVNLACRWIISSANSPFSNTDVINVLAEKNIQWIPDVVSNAGAVICDSFEMKQNRQYSSLPSHSVYDCIYNKILSKADHLIHVSENYRIAPHDSLNIFLNVGDNNILQEAV